MLSARIFIVALLPALLFGCTLTTSPHVSPALSQSAAAEAPALAGVRFSIQVGAFSTQENAIRLEKTLRVRGLDAFYFRHESGLYKVRFGDYPTCDRAREEAERLLRTDTIGEFLIVRPEEYADSRIRHDRGDELRRKLVETAVRFLGAPYSRGGESAGEGFDCSGLTMAVYRLNGLKLPRESARQFRAGRHRSRQNLEMGDLVFFATDARRRVSHVGLYVGEGKFIHAPRPGKTVRIGNLDSGYFHERYVGGRSYF